MRLERADRARLAAGLASLCVGAILMAAKFAAFKMTGSSAIFSDALESIVNVLAAAFAVGSILFAGRPADRGHPYGHGKIEFFSAAFEGGLIAFAAVLIAYKATESLIHSAPVQKVDLGILITVAAGVANMFLGLFLIRAGRKTNSLILTADGQHVLSDFYTTIGVVIGLVLVRLTGIAWLDPLVAYAIAIHLARTGFLMVRHSARALLDEEDSGLLGRILEAGEAVRAPGIIRLHHLRAIRAGRFTHVDAHIVVPEFWSVEEAHERTDAFERRLLDECRIEGEVAFHTDPCRRLFCKVCDLSDCPIRAAAFERRPILTLEEATQPDLAPGQPPPVLA